MSLLAALKMKTCTRWMTLLLIFVFSSVSTLFLILRAGDVQPKTSRNCCFTLSNPSVPNISNTSAVSERPRKRNVKIEKPPSNSRNVVGNHNYSVETNNNINNNNNGSLDWQKDQIERQRRLADVCSRLVTGRRWTAAEIKNAARRADTLFVDDRRRYIYCLVPKVACTTWTRVLLVASGKVREKTPNSLPQHKVNWLRHVGKILRPLARYSADQVEYRLKNYYKFMFTRHPFDRLLSAYRDRLQAEHGLAKRALIRAITNDFKPNTTDSLSQTGRRRNRRRRKPKQSVPFSDFVRYVADQRHDPKDANQHWRPQSELCHPCHIQYDFIGEYNTLTRDAEVVLRKLGISQTGIKFPGSDPDNRRRVRTRDLVRKMMETSAPGDVAQLTDRVYRDDFILFGYTRDNINATL